MRVRYSLASFRKPAVPPRPLVPLALAFAVGILAADVWQLEPGPGLLGALLLFLPVLAAGRLRPCGRLLWCVPWFFVGCEVLARACHVDLRLDVGRIATAEGRLVSIRGRVVETPLGGGSGTYRLAVAEAGLPWRPAAGRLSFFLSRPGADAPRHGDRVEIIGRLLPPLRAGNPGQSDLERIARRRGIRARLAVGEGAGIARLAAGPAWHPLRCLEALRNALARWAEHRLAPAPGGLLRALVLGDRQALAEPFAERFRRGGILHYLAISGLHVALAAGVLRRVLRLLGLGRGWIAAILLAVLALQAGLAGFRTPVVRAAVLAAGTIVAPVLVRSADPWNLMGAAALTTLLLRPEELFAAGFGLSYGAVAGILLLARRLDPSPRIVDLPGEHWLWRALKRLVRAALGTVAVSVAAWCGSGPLIWEWFGAAHPWVPLVNVAVMPVFVVTLTAALIASVAAPLGPPADVAAGVFGWTAAALDAAGRLAAGLPGAELRVPAVGSAVLAASYLLLLAAGRRLALAAFIPVALIGAAFLVPPPSSRPEITVLDVRQGLCVFLASGGGDFALYDAGSTDFADVAAQAIAPFLRERRVARCTTCFLSHGDRDHTSGLASLVRAGFIDSILTASTRDVPAGLPLVLVSEGAQGGGPDWRWRALHPPHGQSAVLSGNDASLVVLVELAGLRLLLPGDVQAAGLARLLRVLDRPVDVLVLPHHGGHAWNLKVFLAHAAPRIVLVSSRRGFEDPRTLGDLEALGIPAFFTWRDGALTVRWDARGIEVSGHLGARLVLARGLVASARDAERPRRRAGACPAAPAAGRRSRPAGGSHRRRSRRGPACRPRRRRTTRPGGRTARFRPARAGLWWR
ncbi:MAG: ComEC/Rec2 family competence protein [Planctomycetes bacterium]|nr:ComEC/Rec2 family competence protein [Planctomycetota bacterium]